MVFPVVMYGCKSWTIKKAERRRIDAFELWCWRRLLRVPWTARRSNQSILKISPGCSLKGLMLKLNLQYFGHLIWSVDSWKEEKGTTEDEMAGWHHQLDGHGFGWTPGVGDGQGSLACCGSWSRKESDTTERLNWTELTLFLSQDQIQDTTPYSGTFLFQGRKNKGPQTYYWWDGKLNLNLLAEMNCPWLINNKSEVLIFNEYLLST